MAIEKKNSGLLFVLVIILCFMYILMFEGGLRSVNDAIMQRATITTGYSECIYSVEIGENDIDPLALVGGDGVTQPIYIDEEMLTNEKLMLGFYMATYGRENTGKLCVELRQEDEIQTYVTEMMKVKNFAYINLVFSTEKFHEGIVNVRIYSPDSTWENCVALYLTRDSSTYDAIYMNGEQVEKNAVIFLGVPARLTKSEFENVSVEALPLVGGDGVTQPIYMDEEMLTNEKLMLGFYMATYGRENTGKLYVELRQEDEIQTYVAEMKGMEDNANINLVFSTEKFHEGTINVRIYSPDSTWENCVALYLTNDSRTYDAIYMNGEQIEKNAIIFLSVPSRLTKSDFEYVSL